MNERQAMACAIYLVGYHVVTEVLLRFMPVSLLVSEKVLDVEAVMEELGAGQCALIAACGPWRCTWFGIVGFLLPVALAWGQPEGSSRDPHSARGSTPGRGAGRTSQRASSWCRSSDTTWSRR